MRDMGNVKEEEGEKEEMEVGLHLQSQWDSSHLLPS